MASTLPPARSSYGAAFVARTSAALPLYQLAQLLDMETSAAEAVRVMTVSPRAIEGARKALTHMKKQLRVERQTKQHFTRQ